MGFGNPTGIGPRGNENARSVCGNHTIAFPNIGSVMLDMVAELSDVGVCNVAWAFTLVGCGYTSEVRKAI